MTGKHLGHAQIRGNMQARVKLPEFTEGQIPLSEDAVTLAQVFQRAGYATGAIGKWGLGPVASTGDPNRKGFDLFFGYNCQSVAHSYYPAHLWRNAEKITINDPPIPGHRKQPEGEVRATTWIGENYAPKLMIQEAETFIQTNRDKPFFLYLPFIEPHVAMHPPQGSVDKFPKDWDTKVYRGESSYLPHPRPRAAYAAMISDLDSYVGRVVAAIEKAGLTNRTLIVFSSDNGATHPGPPNTDFHIGGADPNFFKRRWNQGSDDCPIAWSRSRKFGKSCARIFCGLVSDSMRCSRFAETGGAGWSKFVAYHDRHDRGERTHGTKGDGLGLPGIWRASCRTPR
jgi:arylsulfatase A-like enzyme